MDSMGRMKELVELLNRAGKAYYQEGSEIMPNLEYDRLYDELQDLEKQSGIVLSASPTQHVGYEVLSELPKERHESPMLSLDKTKRIPDLEEWLSDKEGLLSWKLDGLTVVLSYEGGKLLKGVTRGNGEVGEVITQNVRAFENVPSSIPFRGKLSLRGEALIRYSDFYAINAGIPEAEAKYKNPRNLCSGSVRQLDPRITAERHVRLVAFSLVSCIQEDGSPMDFENRFSREFDFLQEQGFEVVESRLVTRETLGRAVQDFAAGAAGNDFPSDGLVLCYEDLAYGLSLGRTAKFPRNAIAFKWADTEEETRLLSVEWSPSRTGLINPIACFEPVELEGSTVSRASLHNLSYCEDLALGIGDTVKVYKANMIIPQISENLSRSGNLLPPARCPACGGETEIRQDKDAKYLFCPNPACPAKKIKNFALFVSRDALNIEGLSEATLEKFIGHGFIQDYADIFHPEQHREEIISMEGFGEKSYENLATAVRTASETELYRVIYGLGIAGIGLANAKLLCRAYGNDLEKLRQAPAEELEALDGIGKVLAENIAAYFQDTGKMQSLDALMRELRIREEAGSGVPRSMEGKSVVITGALQHFSNRKELQALIEQAGGRAAGSVSQKTAYLVNNDLASATGKNKKAKELGIPIVSEEEFLEILYGRENNIYGNGNENGKAYRDDTEGRV